MCVLHGSRVELPEVHTEPQAAVLFLYHDGWRSPGTVGRTDDTAGQHLLDLGHFFSTNSGVLAATWLAERGSLGLDGLLKQRGTTQIVLPLTNNFAEFLEEGLQLLLLGRRQVRWDRRWAMWAGSGWWRWSVSDGDDLQSAHGLPGMQAKRFREVVVDRDPHFGSTSKRTHSGHNVGRPSSG